MVTPPSTAIYYCLYCRATTTQPLVRYHVCVLPLLQLLFTTVFTTEQQLRNPRLAIMFVCDGLGIFTVQPGTAPSEDVSIQCVSSDPAVATVTAAVILTAAGGTSTANTKTVTLVYKIFRVCFAEEHLCVCVCQWMC